MSWQRPCLAHNCRRPGSHIHPHVHLGLRRATAHLLVMLVMACCVSVRHQVSRQQMDGTRSNDDALQQREVSQKQAETVGHFCTVDTCGLMLHKDLAELSAPVTMITASARSASEQHDANDCQSCLTLTAATCLRYNPTTSQWCCHAAAGITEQRQQEALPHIACCMLKSCQARELQQQALAVHLLDCSPHNSIAQQAPTHPQHLHHHRQQP